MGDCVDLVTDDDSAPEECSSKIRRKSTKNVESIPKTEPVEIIDLEETPKPNENKNVVKPIQSINAIEEEIRPIETIDLEKTPSNETKHKNIPIQNIISNFDDIKKEDTLFAEFLEKCIELENSDGMIRIINKSVLKAYEKSDEEYRKSLEFKKVMTKALNRLCTDTKHKFSCVYDLVETLKLHCKKKRVQLTTLATNLKENKKNLHNNLEPNKPINIVIDSDEETKGTDMPTINLDECNNDVIDLEQLDAEVNECYSKSNEKEDIENESQGENFLESQVEVAWSDENNLNIENSEPSQTQVITEKDEANDINMKEVENLEGEIAFYKKIINQYEECEVIYDTIDSPYILCERFKLKLVHCYKKLCQLIGEQPVKKRKVRLQVLQGHPPGPVKRLQEFINDNIGEDGVPMFPDFCDVVKCVMVANIEDNLGWNKPQIMKEATALFTQCGQALQKRRQRREYRDLLARVTAEQGDCDPADEDPELRARLQANRAHADKRERDLMERYSMMQDQHSRSGEMFQGSSFGLPSGHNMPNRYIPNEDMVYRDMLHGDILKEHRSNGDIPNECMCHKGSGSSLVIQDVHSLGDMSNRDNPHRDVSNRGIPNEQMSNGHIETGPSIMIQNVHSLGDMSNRNMAHKEFSNGAISNEHMSNGCIESGPSLVIQDVHSLADAITDDIADDTDTPINLNDESDDSNFEPPEVSLSQNNEANITVHTHNEKETDNQEVKVKREPVDIIQMLNELGDNYTTTVVDILDPFLVIEISSDSSDEEIDNREEETELRAFEDSYAVFLKRHCMRKPPEKPKRRRK